MNFKQLLLKIFSFALLIVAVYYFYFFLHYLWTLLLSIDKQVSAAIIATSGTVLAAVAVSLYSQRKTKDREIAEAHRPQKIELYKSFMDTVTEVLRDSKNKNNNSNSEEFTEKYTDFFIKFTSDVIVWGSPEVIKAYEKFRVGSSNNVNVLLLVDDILREIRKDLGNSNWRINRGELIKLFLKDPDELDKKME